MFFFCKSTFSLILAPMIAVHGPPASLTVVGVSDNTATVPGRGLGHQAALARPLELA